MHIKKIRLDFMKRAPNSSKTDVMAHFFMLIEGNMLSVHEMQQIGCERIDRMKIIGQDISRVLYLTIIYLVLPLPTGSSDLPLGR